NLQKGLDIRSKLEDDPIGLFQSFNNLGAIYMKNGDLEKSLSFFQKGHSHILEDKTKNLELAISYNNLGRVYEAMGKVDFALNYFERALKSFQVLLGEDHYYAAILLNNIGHIFLQKNDPDKALSFFNLAQNIFKKPDPNHPNVALTHVNMAKCYYKKGERDKELKHLKAALILQKGILNPDHPDIATTLNNLGIHFFQENKPELALEYFQDALITLIPEFDDKSIFVNPTLEAEINSKMILLKILENKAKALEKLYLQNEEDDSALEISLNTYQIAIRLIDDLRIGFTEEESRKDLTEKSFSIYEGAIQTSTRLHQVSKEIKYLELAFGISQQSKAFLLLQALKNANGLQFAGVPDSLIEKERDLKTEVAFYERELYLAQQKNDSVPIRLYQNYLYQFKTELEKISQNFETNYPKYYELKYNYRLPMLSDIQKELINEEEVLLDYFVGDSTITIFRILKDHLAVYNYKKPDKFNDLVQDFKKATEEWQFIVNHPEQADELYLNSAIQMYSLLLREPLESINETVNRIIIIPGGILGYMNFEAFINDPPNSPKNFKYGDLDYLIKNYDVHYLFSAATYLNGKENILAKPTGKIFGGFAVDDTSLPGAVKEVNLIAGIMGGEAWTGIHANEKYFKTKAMNYPVLHLSMHAFLDDIQPLYSKFVFSQSQDESEDDSLTIAEIYNMNFNAQMAVLSACETADGTLSRGEGIMSLSRAFAYAGCPSIVTSLWKVDSKTTSTLMVDFYKNLVQGLPKDRSLRLAKLNYLKSTEDPLLAHPHFWLSFIVTGDTAPLNFEKRFSMWLGIAILLGIILGIILLRKKRTQLRNHHWKKTLLL
ncbi:MAG: CHAT domain-containing tetratricopeptide repeat protein, partial [Cyclobacteriaceae bacterium]